MDTRYSIARNKQIYATLRIDELNDRIRAGDVLPSDWIYIPEGRDWWPIVEIQTLATQFYRVEDKPDAKPVAELPSPRKPGTLIEVSRRDVEFEGHIQDRRHWIRTKDALGMRITFVTETGQEIRGPLDVQTADLSEVGAAFYWEEEPAPGAKLALELDIFPLTLRAKAQIIRCYTTTGQEYRIGLRFTSMSEEDKNSLRRYIRESAGTASAAVRP